MPYLKERNIMETVLYIQRVEILESYGETRDYTGL